MNVDVLAELEVFEWRESSLYPEKDPYKLQACSPFREDRKPSFYVWLRDRPDYNAYAGQWGDSGGVRRHERGGFIHLLSFLRQETEEETIDYLLAKYGNDEKDYENISFDLPWLRERAPRQRRKPLDKAILTPYRYRHPYLSRRGISERVQRGMHIGYDQRSRAVTIPWFLPDGRLGNVKFRRVHDKAFWFRKGGWPIRDMVYGLDVIHRKQCEEAVLVEAEIDAMYVMTAGYPAIALGGAKMSDAKRDLIVRSPLKRVIIAADNDVAGAEMKQQVIEKLSGFVEIAEVMIPKEYKDLNEIKSLEDVRQHINQAREMHIFAS